MKFVVLAGVAQGLAFLCKMYPALIVTVFSVAALWTSRRKLGIFIAAAIVTAAPWFIYCAIRFPTEFRLENALILRHLNENVEGWAGPWDRLLFDYLLRIFYLLYPAVLFAMIALLPRMWRERNRNLALIFVWALGVIVPHTLATTKTPSATLLAWPAMWLIFAAMIWRAVAGELFLLIGWATLAILAALFSGHIAGNGIGYPQPYVFAGVMQQALWVVWHVLIALLVAAVGVRIIRNQLPLRVTLIVGAAALTLVPISRMLHQCWSVTEFKSGREPDFRAIGEFARNNLPANAVLIVQEREKFDYMSAMFWADRTCYPLRGYTYSDLARQVVAHHGKPYIVSVESLPGNPLFYDDHERRAVYELK
jgi:hypothetical protein